MNNRQTIMSAIDRVHSATADELHDLVPMFSSQKIRDTVKDLVKINLLSRERDDVTGSPVYLLTDAGRAWLAGQKINVRATPAAGGGNISGSHARDSVVDGGPRTDPPSRGVAVVEQPKPDDAPVEACSDELSDWRHKAAYYGINSPNALDHYCANANNKLAQAEKQRDDHFATADDLRNQLALAENALGEWLRLANQFGCEGWHQLRNRLETLHALESDEGTASAPVAYLVRAPKRKPRLCGKHESAIAAAKAVAKTTGRADVLALVPVGSARRQFSLTVEFTEAA